MSGGWFDRLRQAFASENRYSAEERALHALSQAYIDLLRMPQGGVRARNQKCLVALRDALADETGDTPEIIQNFYERWVSDPDGTKRRIDAALADDITKQAETQTKSGA